MTTNYFFKNFDKYRPVIQNLASKLTEDFNTARFLYIETVHKAMKKNDHHEQATFNEWLNYSIRKTYEQYLNSNTLKSN